MPQMVRKKRKMEQRKQAYDRLSKNLEQIQNNLKNSFNSFERSYKSIGFNDGRGRYRQISHHGQDFGDQSQASMHGMKKQSFNS